MIINGLFWLLLIASCNGLARFSVYTMDKGVDVDKKSGVEYVCRPDEDVCNKESSERYLGRLKDWYSSLIDRLDPFIDPEIVILDIYNSIERDHTLPLLGDIGERACHKAEKVWKRGKKVFGREQEIFKNDRTALALIHGSFTPIKPEYKQDCQNMSLDLAGRLLLTASDYEALFKRFDDFEQSLSQEDRQTCSDALIHVKMLCIQYFDTIKKLPFYCSSYPGLLSFMFRDHLPLCPFPALFPFVLSTLSPPIINGFLRFCKKQGMDDRTGL